jgi:hypothetical protein
MIIVKNTILSMEECANCADAMGGSQHSRLTYFDAAKYLANGTDLSLDAIRKSLAECDDDFEAAALAAYNLAVNDRNRETLRILASTDCFAKSEPLPEINVPQQFRIHAFNKDGEKTAEQIQCAFDNGYYNRVNLNGKHSVGSMVCKDPRDNTAFLLKPDVSDPSPAAGMADSINSPSERAAAFWQVANAVGLGGDMPQCDLVLVDNHQTAAMRLLPIHYKNLGLIKATEPNLPREVLEPYRKTGQIHKWAILYWILGETDAHSSNIMYSKQEGRCVLIDHGASMAGVNFNPAFDENSYIPFFLRAFSGTKFKTMGPVDRASVLPRVPDSIELILEDWVASITPQKLAWILRKYEIDPAPMLARLNQIQRAPKPVWQSINRLWAGVGV